MRPRRDPVPRARDSWVWLGSFLLLGLLGAAFVGAASLLWEHVDIRQIAPELAQQPASPPPAALPAGAARPGGSFPVVLLRSRQNREFHPDSAFYPRALDRWRTVAEGVGGVVREIAPEDLSRVAAADVLLLPEATCLTRDQTEAVEAHLERGGGVVANWAFGARDESCAWVGWQAVSRLTRSSDVREIPAREDLYLTLPDGVALASGLPAGTRIGLRGDPVLARGDTGARPFWSDWAMNPAPEREGGPDGAAVTLRTPAGGRVAWFGFRLGQAASTEDARLLRRVVENGILWAAGRPQAAVATWPRGQRAALLPVVEVETEPGNAVEIARILREEGVPGTFFVVPGLVSGNAALAAELTSAGEVGIQTVDHSPLLGRTLPDQSATLRRTRREVARWAGVDPVGLRPPEERFDPLTVTAWAGEGGRYLVALNEARSAAPELHVREDDSLVVIPRLVKDDYNVVVQEGAVRSARLTEAWEAGLEKMGSLGGVAVVGGHTQILRTEGRLEAWRASLRGATRAGDWWITTGREIDEWWRARSRIAVRWTGGDAGSDTLALEVRIDGDAPVEAQVWLDVILPRTDLPMEPWVDGEPVISVVTPWGLRLPVGPLRPGEPRQVQLRPGT